MIYEGDEYVEPGYIAILNGEDYSNSVIVNGEVDINTPGKYDIEYVLKIENEERTISRIVRVLENNSDDIILKLKGGDKIYLVVNDQYEELGAEAYYQEDDISNNIEIKKEIYEDTDKTKEVDDIDTSIENTYKIIYTISYMGKEKSIERTIYILDLDNIFSVDLENMLINIKLDDRYSYVRYPSGAINSQKNTSYGILGSGEYKFIIYSYLNNY